MAASAVALGLVAAPVMAQDARAIRAAEQVRDQALKGNIALDYVTQITTRFGPRPAGSRAEQDASAWAADYMRAHGFQNVRIEQFPLIGWERGEESAEILGARPQKLVVAALGHSIATPAEGVEAEVVFFDGLDALLAAPAGGVGPTEAAKRGAVAFVMRSAGSDEHRMPHTGTTRYVEGKVPLPAFALSAPDADQVARLVGMGETVRLRLKSTAHTYETHSQNVMGDIVGASRPNEIIVLGSHMDSWDLGTGAIDDAAGGAITLAAAKLIAEQGRPARTIRVVLYGSEEVAQPTDHGNGGGAYVRNIGAGVEKHVIAGESDFGADRVYALGLPPGSQNTDFAKIAERVLRPLGVLPGEAELFGGVDIGPLARAGVPVFGLRQDGTRYFDLHHTADDTLDKIDPAQMTQNVAAWAALVRLIADSDVDFRAARAAQASTR
ncbi:MAG: peptidase M20 [Brevundimonas diminuta]|nr:MAG: peptidase M20 [Brevundimonas diminuta]